MGRYSVGIRRLNNGLYDNYARLPRYYFFLASGTMIGRMIDSKRYNISTTTA